MQNEPRKLEIEVKFHLEDPALTRDRLLAIGAQRSPKVFETNIRYDDTHRRLRSSGKLLRLRKDTGCRLTFKSPPPASDTEFKVFHELEVVVGDFQTTSEILKAIGFQPVQTYEKWRETYTVKDVEVCIDTMPYGVFLEIEGSEAGITSMARDLGLVWGQRILENYLAIFELVRAKFALPFHDVTFANFKGRTIELSAVLPDLYAEY
jgi:adenylate cyclase class 2